MTHCWFHQLINMRQWIDILRAGLVQIDEVHAHPTFAISLLDHHHISQPVRVINIPDKFAIISFWTSSLMALSHSGANTLFFWHTGLEEGYTFRQCVMTLRSILGMSRDSMKIHQCSSLRTGQGLALSYFPYLHLPLYTSQGYSHPKECLPALRWALQQLSSPQCL